VSVVAVVLAPGPDWELCPEPPLLVRAIRGLLKAGCVDTVLVAADRRQEPVVLPPGYDLPASVLTVAVDLPAGRHAATAARDLGFRAVRTWQRSANATRSDVDVLLVQDPRRALTPPFVIASVVAAIRDGAGEAVPVLPVTDTIKRVTPSGVVSGTVDRGTLRTVQGPRGFATAQAADDTAPRFVPGHARAMRITTALDLAVAESITAEEPL
jgi:2-C-methyl-D-erythritol 4-phosphate cytidylyltransferase